jgi:hypothetical protein
MSGACTSDYLDIAQVQSRDPVPVPCGQEQSRHFNKTTQRLNMLAAAPERGPPVNAINMAPWWVLSFNPGTRTDTLRMGGFAS